ncbi:MAG: DUF4349 domain-containing protein [Bacteroidetes bacterium]|nr:DUF4349 domain-containing protein [Bacteroidota bacterium]
MKTSSKIYLTLVTILALAACNGKLKEENYAADAAPPPVMDQVSFTPPDVLEKEVLANAKMDQTEATGEGQSGVTTKIQVKIPSKIRKTADINITVDDYKKARTEIEKIIKSANSYIGNENEQRNTYSISNDMVIRVVNKDFESMVDKLLGVAKDVNSKSVSAEDVTAQFVDLQSRLRSKKEIEKRYLDILQKANKVSDILEIEQKIGEIREEIEAKEGELKYLADQVDYSTINLTFHEDFEYTPSDKPGFWGRVGTAFGTGWNGFLSFLVGMVYAWPLWLMLGTGTFFLVRFIKRKLKK